MSKRKYRRGSKIRNISELLRHDYFILSTSGKDKTLHAGFVRSWQLQVCDTLIKRGMIYAAERI